MPNIGNIQSTEIGIPTLAAAEVDRALKAHAAPAALFKNDAIHRDAESWVQEQVRPESSDIVAYARKMSIPLVNVSNRQNHVARAHVRAALLSRSVMQQLRTADLLASRNLIRATPGSVFNRTSIIVPKRKTHGSVFRSDEAQHDEFVDHHPAKPIYHEAHDAVVIHGVLPGRFARMLNTKNLPDALRATDRQNEHLQSLKQQTHRQINHSHRHHEHFSQLGEVLFQQNMLSQLGGISARRRTVVNEALVRIASSRGLSQRHLNRNLNFPFTRVTPALDHRVLLALPDLRMTQVFRGST
jgi:hypothetical protein